MKFTTDYKITESSGIISLFKIVSDFYFKIKIIVKNNLFNCVLLYLTSLFEGGLP